MYKRHSAAHEAAKKEYERAATKPSAGDLARKHGLSPSTIYRAPWFKVPSKQEAAK